MCHIVMCGLSGSNKFFSTKYHKRHNFRKKKVIEHNIYALVIPTEFETFLILRRTERAMIIDVIIRANNKM